MGMGAQQKKRKVAARVVYFHGWQRSNTNHTLKRSFIPSLIKNILANQLSLQ